MRAHTPLKRSVASKSCSFGMFSSQSANILGSVHMGLDPFGSYPKPEWIGLVYTQDFFHLVQFGSAICTSLGQME